MKLIFDIGFNKGSFTEICFNKHPNCKVVAVEANPKLIDSGKDKFKYNNNFTLLNNLVSNLNDESTNFYICDYADGVSTASLNFIKNSRFTKGSKNLEVNSVSWADPIKVTSITLDNLISQYGEPDLIKIDVQGYEDEIIKHGKQTIKDTLVLQIELSPVPSYEGGKPFGHITNELESLNFHLHQFSKIETRSFKPTVIGGNSKWGLHYIYQLDCVFIKNFDEIENFSLNDLLKLSYIMYYGFNAFDFVDFLFQIIDKKYNKNYLNDFRKSILEFKVNKT